MNGIRHHICKINSLCCSKSLRCVQYKLQLNKESQQAISLTVYAIIYYFPVELHNKHIM